VGSPEKFSKWLSDVQESHGHEYEFIEHPHRYSHLRKFYYRLDNDTKPFKSIDSHKDRQKICFLHPISLLSPDRSVLPSDLSLEARDVLTLYEALIKFFPDADLAGLNPSLVFGNIIGFIKQQDILLYEASLKSFVTAQIVQAARPDQLRQMIKSLTDLHISTTESDKTPSKDVFLQNLVPMLCDLHHNNQLVSLFFPIANFAYVSSRSLPCYFTLIELDVRSWRITYSRCYQKLKTSGRLAVGTGKRKSNSGRTGKERQRIVVELQREKNGELLIPI
jgi:ATP-dependent RNA helicase DDX60